MLHIHSTPTPVSANDLIPLAEACKLPVIRRVRAGKRLNYATIWRWWKRGVRGCNDHRIRLAVVKVGATPCTTERSLQEFFKALGQTNDTPAVTTPRERRVRIAIAERELAARGM